MHVVVIGAGLLGVSTAYFLSRNGHRVTVLETDSGAGRGTSYANAALLTPSHAMPWSEPSALRRVLSGIGRPNAAFRLRARGVPALLRWGAHYLRRSGGQTFEGGFRANLRLAQYTRDVMDELDDSEALDYSRAARGTLTIVHDHRSLADLQRLAHLWDAMGVRQRVLDATEVVAHEPALASIADDIAAGVLNPDDGHGDAHVFCEQLAERAARLGVEFRFGVRVERLVCDSDRVRTVQTGSGELRADRVVIAAGAASTALARQAGLRLPMVPIRGISVTVEGLDAAALPRLPVLDHDTSIAIAPLGRRLRIAGGAEFAGLDRRIDRRRCAGLQALFESLFPRARATDRSAQYTPWAGLRPASVDGVPFIGETRLGNLYLNTGHGHLGWTLAAGSGRALADLVSGRRPDIDLAPFRLDRF